MTNAEPRSPVSQRPRSCPYQDYVNQQQRSLSQRGNRNKELHDGPKLWRQMMMGFTCAGFVGLIMLVLGTIFIAEAVRKQQPITVMMCVMGIVFGIIILVGTFILGKVLISRKWIRCQGRETTPPASQCFHTCSVIYSPSLDQLGASESMLEPPPAYDTLSVRTPEQEQQEDGGVDVHTIVFPPKYDEVTKPLPQYVEEVIVADVSTTNKETEIDTVAAD